jgi:hypothetical protein
MKNYLYIGPSKVEGIYYEEESPRHYNAIHKLPDCYALFLSSHLPLGYQILPDRDTSIYYKVRKMLNMHYTVCTNILELSARGVNHEFRVKKSYGCYSIYGPDHLISLYRDGVQIYNHPGKNLGWEYIIYPDTFYDVLQRTRDILVDLDKVWKTI